MLNCSYCAFSTTTQYFLVQHYVKKHKDEESFTLQCSICQKYYKCVASLRSHVWSKHHEVMQLQSNANKVAGSARSTASSFFMLPTQGSPDEQVVEDGSGDNDVLSFASVHSEQSVDVTTCEEVNIEPEKEAEVLSLENVNSEQSVDNETGRESDPDRDPEGDPKRDESTCAEANIEQEKQADEKDFNLLHWQSSEFLLKLREEGMISQTALSKAIEGVDDLFHNYTQTIKERIIQDVEKDGRITEENIQKIFKEFEDGIFVDGGSKSSLEAFCEEYGEMLTPEPVVLGEEEVFSEDGTVKVVKHCAYVCPFVPALKRLLKRPDVLDCVDNPVEVSEDGVIRSYRDGTYCKEHEILSKPGSLAVICVFDELEISSPLGPKKHKLGLYYWTLANFYPTMRSSLKSIQLYAIVWSKDLKKETPVSGRKSLDAKFENHTKIMAPFVEGINELEKGIKVEVKPSTEREFDGALYCVCGDAPAVSVFCGCKESVGQANKPCLRCLVENEEMKVVFNEDMFQMRTLALRAKHLQSIDVSQLVKDRILNSTLCGVNGPSVIEGLNTFDYISAFVFDLMHILHEGVLEAHLRMLLHYAVTNKYFTLEEINRGVHLIAQQILLTDKPALMKIEHLTTGIRQNAGQMLSLALCLPFVLMKKSTELGERLDNFIRLLKISMGLLSYEVSSAELAELKSLIRQHHEAFTIHYTSFVITPKFHFLVHLPSQILQFGPSRVTWTMRFEAMHSYFKDLMRIMKNFINPPKSCSYRYECMRAAQMLTLPNGEPQPYFNSRDVTTYSRSLTVKEHTHAELLLKILGKRTLNVTSCASLKTNGVTYKRKSVVLLDADKPLFAEVVDIVMYGDIHILVVSVLKTVQFNSLCNAFVVESQHPQILTTVLIENLSFFQTLPSLEIDSVHYVIPKYHRLGFMPFQ